MQNHAKNNCYLQHLELEGNLVSSDGSDRYPLYYGPGADDLSSAGCVGSQQHCGARNLLYSVKDNVDLEAVRGDSHRDNLRILSKT